MKAVRARGFLRRELSNGDTEVNRLVARAKHRGISERSLYRAAKELGVEKHRSGFSDKQTSVWHLKVRPLFSRSMADV